MRDVQLSTLRDVLRTVFVDTSEAAFRMRPYRKVPARTDNSLLGVGENETDICACQTHSVPRETLHKLANGHKKNVILHWASRWLTESLLAMEQSYSELLRALGPAMALRQTIDTIKQFFEFNVDDIPEIFREWTVRALHSEVRFVSQRVDSDLPVDPRLIDQWAAIAEALAKVFRREFETKLTALAEQGSACRPVHEEKEFSKRRAFVLPLLEQRGWSILDWAQYAGVDFHTANGYFKNKRNPYRSTRKKLAESLGLKCEQLPE
jgi:hypothetical protein